MRYSKVCLESFGYVLPDEIITSDELEHQLQPLYSRLKLPEGRLELITGIRQRRFWPAGMLPSQKSVASGQWAMEAADLDPAMIGALIHGSVCRDYLEPATACSVHHGLGLAPSCVIYDTSNACLGLINGMLQIANMIELEQISAGLVVGTESSRQLIETTIASLNSDESLTRQTIKPAFSSLTIGSGSCAILLVHERLSRTGNHLLGTAVKSNTSCHDLCQSDRDNAVGSGMQPLMETDAEQLMAEGIRIGVEAFADFLAANDWTHRDIDRAFCHQVGSTHRRLMLESIGLSEEIDYATFPALGNTGSVALPITMAIAADDGILDDGGRLAMLGIGSGINCLMIGCHWRNSLVKGHRPAWNSSDLASTKLAMSGLQTQ